MKVRTCTQRRYKDRIAALLALENTGRKRHTGRQKDERRAYRCPDCCGWHLTSKDERR
jgi:hypothetical protein